MTTSIVNGRKALCTSPQRHGEDERYVAWFHELGAWTTYWDIYHPETRGHFYFGDGDTELGLLTRILPRDRCPPAFEAWARMAVVPEAAPDFAREVRVPEVASAVMEMDALLGRLFARHFGDPTNPCVQADYLEAVFRFAIDSLPLEIERNARVAEAGPSKPKGARDTLDDDFFWFAWALQLEAAYAIAGMDKGHTRRALLLAGAATGCPAHFAWRGHRRTRGEYSPDEKTARVLRERGLRWASDFWGAAEEIRALYRIREWGEED
jgi:hypothetical protein